MSVVRAQRVSELASLTLTLTVWPPLAPTWKSGTGCLCCRLPVPVPVPSPCSRFLLLNCVVLAMRSMLLTACSDGLLVGGLAAVGVIGADVGGVQDELADVGQQGADLAERAVGRLDHVDGVVGVAGGLGQTGVLRRQAVRDDQAGGVVRR